MKPNSPRPRTKKTTAPLAPKTTSTLASTPSVLPPFWPAAGPRVLHRGELARIEYIHQRLRCVRPDNTVKVTAEGLARELCRSRTVIFETLDKMREVFGAPIKYDVVRGTQYYDQPPGARPFELHPPLSLDVPEALALIFGTRRVFPFGGSSATALAKILPLLGGGDAPDPAALDAVCSAPECAAREIDVQRLLLLFFAILRRQEVRLVYGKLVAGAVAAPRTLHPLHLVLLADSCLLVAHEPGGNEPKSFDVARTRELELTGATFTPPATFNIKTYLAGGMGRFLGEPKHEVRLRIVPSFVAYLEERPWQRTQKLLKFPDGSAEATYHVAHTAEIEQRVLATGGQVEVLSPPDLRERIRAAAESVRLRHAA